MNRRSLHSSPPEVLRFSGSPPRKRSKRTDSQPSSLRPPSRPHPSHVSSPHHCAVLTSGAGCRGVGRQCQVRGELPGQMQHGAVRRDAALRTDRPGRLRLLSGLCGGQRGALLPHRVGDARGEVRTGLILRVLQGRGRLRGRIRDLQRCVHMQRLDLPVVGCFCLWAALWLCDALLHQMQHVITVFLGSVYWIITSDSSCIIAMWVSVEEAHEKMCPSWFNLMIRSSDAWIFHQFAFLCVYLSHFSWSLWFGAQIGSSHTPASPHLFAQTTLNECLLSLQTACTGPTGSSAARHAAAKVASVTGRREPVSPSNSSPKSPATWRVSRKQVNVPTKIGSVLVCPVRCPPKSTKSTSGKASLVRDELNRSSLCFQGSKWAQERSAPPRARTNTQTDPRLRRGSTLADRRWPGWISSV